MKAFLAAILLVLALTALTVSQALSQEGGLEKYGYSVVLASVNFVPGQSLTVTVPDQVSAGILPKQK